MKGEIVLARPLADAVRKAFQDPAVRADFEKWYKERYGKEYEWQQQRVRD